MLNKALVKENLPIDVFSTFHNLATQTNMWARNQHHMHKEEVRHLVPMNQNFYMSNTNPQFWNNYQSIKEEKECMPMCARIDQHRGSEALMWMPSGITVDHRILF